MAGCQKMVFCITWLLIQWVDFDKLFFLSYIFGHGESISDTFRPAGPPAEPLMLFQELRRVSGFFT